MATLVTMGEVIRKVNIGGLTGTGKITKTASDVVAIVDTGATTTVISQKLAKRLGGRNLKYYAHIEGRSVPLKLVVIKLKVKGCEEDAITVAVDSRLASRAGKTSSGDPIEIILGHDYLQRRNVTLHGNVLKCQVRKPRKNQ